MALESHPRRLLGRFGGRERGCRLPQSGAQFLFVQLDEDLALLHLSPMDGLVLSRDVEVGDAVSSILVLGSEATLLIMRLGDVRDVYVLGKVDQADIGKVYLGQRARIVVKSFKDREFDGRVTKIAPLGVEKDNVTTFEVRVSIQNPTGELKANRSANAEILPEEKHNVLLISEGAVIYDQDRKTFVEVPDPVAERGQRKVPVKLGISDGVKTELLAGLREGDKVLLPRISVTRISRISVTGYATPFYARPPPAPEIGGYVACPRN